MLNPHARKRQDSVVVKAHLSPDLTNTELLVAFHRAMQGKLSQHTIDQYASILKDVIAYHTSPEGVELHVSQWQKEHIWEYVHHVEANYCRYLQPYKFNDATGATCRSRVWIGGRPFDEAVKLCAGCKLFEHSTDSVQRRLDAIHKFMRFMARSGVVPLNFMRDVVAEYYEDVKEGPRREKRRNPSIEEMRQLVNGTANLRNRAFYAASAKWGFRLNEMLALDRYTSLPNFAQGGDLVILPEWKGKLDKRKGNRVSVIDAELRPILEQYLRWWEHNVRRNDDGTPLTTKLWLSEHGRALNNDPDFYDRVFYPDCYRLGLMKPGDEQDPLRRWTAHCQRHFLEKVLMMADCPDTWSKHFRGDIVKDARGHYFVPTPEQIREKYLEWMPKLGLQPVPQPDPRHLPQILRADATSIHVAILQEGHARVAAWTGAGGPVISSRIVAVDEHGAEIRHIAYVQKRRAPSFLFAYQRLYPTLRLSLRADTDAPVHGRAYKKRVLLKQFEDALAALGAQPR